MQGYIILGLIIAEFLVFIVEALAYLIAIRERRVLTTFLYVITANFLAWWQVVFNYKVAYMIFK